MKVVKLTKKFKYFQDGFTHAIRFDYGEWSVSNRFISWLRQKYGYEPYTVGKQKSHMFMAYVGSGSYKNKNVPYWILVRDEKVITFMLLAVEHS